MTFRSKLLAVFVPTVVAAVSLVSWTVSETTRRAFERIDDARSAALVGQFRREFAARRTEVARRVEGIASLPSIQQMAIDIGRPQPDYSSYVDQASALATAHGLDFLELVGNDGAIISSAQWPARFGYKEEWVTEPAADWKQESAFLKREQLPEGEALALVAVDAVKAGDQKLYVIGGERMDKEFLASLALPAGMRALLYQEAENPKLAPIIDQVRRTRREATGTVLWSGDPASAEAFHAIPLMGRENNLLAVVLVGSSRRELVELVAFIRRIGLWMGGAGVLLALVLAWWATARVTRPVQRLAEGARRIGLWMGGAGVLLALVLAWWATARVTRPVKRLAEGARRVAAGDWNTRVALASGDEIGELARAFNQMTQQLLEQRDRLIQAERVAAWRELARRLAHELKNPLFPLQITVENLQRAREQHPEQFDEVFRESTATLLTELSNLKQIIGRFSDFAKMPPPELHTVDVNEIVGQTMALFRAQLEAPERPPIVSRLELAGSLPPIPADPEQLSRALGNLVLNAIDAMPKGGTLTVRTARCNGAVRLEVSDTGQGLTKEECERLFTPYYTTKEHGTGLGLAIVQSVVSDHKGRISVSSEPGKGTTFRIDLQA